MPRAGAATGALGTAKGRLGKNLLGLLAVVALANLCGPMAAVRAETAERIIVIGSAPAAGVSFAVGGALCSLVNRDRARHGLRCLVEGTRGSADNLERLRRGEIDFALVQSDWQYLAARSGIGPQPQPFEDLRALLSLHAQAVTVVANPQAGIERLEDIKGRRINLGPAGSGIRAVAEALIGALGWRARDFETLADLGVDAQVEALCNGRIDAFVLPVSHPNGAVAEATGSCGAILVEVAGSAIERLIAAWPFYAPARIPAGTYRGNAEDVRTYGTRATLVTTAALPEDAVYEFVKSVFGKLDQLPAEHAALAGLDTAQMLGAVNTATFHAGALRYYRERGWK